MRGSRLCGATLLSRQFSPERDFCQHQSSSIREAKTKPDFS